MYFLQVRLHSTISCCCCCLLPLVQHVSGHCKQLTRAEKSNSFVSYRHLACGHFRACRFWQMALKFKHSFWCSGIDKPWKGAWEYSEPSSHFWLFPFWVLHLSLGNRSFESSFESLLVSSFLLSCIYHHPPSVFYLQTHRSDFCLSLALDWSSSFKKCCFPLKPLLNPRLCLSEILRFLKAGVAWILYPQRLS